MTHICKQICSILISDKQLTLCSDILLNQFCGDHPATSFCLCHDYVVLLFKSIFADHSAYSASHSFSIIRSPVSVKIAIFLLKCRIYYNLLFTRLLVTNSEPEASPTLTYLQFQFNFNSFICSDIYI